MSETDQGSQRGKSIKEVAKARRQDSILKSSAYQLLKNALESK